jgi:hypothetical protein
MKDPHLRLHSSIEPLESRIAPATFTVTSTLDGNVAGTLRWAVQQANAAAGADTITFNIGVGNTIELTDGQLTITDAVAINGPGAGALTIDAGNQSRIFEIEYAGAVLMPTAITGMTLVHGNTTGDGGAISSHETTYLSGLIVGENHARGNGGGVSISTDGEGYIINCLITKNTARGDGGGLYLESGEKLLIRGSVFSKNKASGDGGGIFLKVAAQAAADAVINGSEIKGNFAGGDGGGIQLSDASARQKIVIRGSAITNNRAIHDGGGTAIDSGAVIVAASVISANTAGDEGGGIADRSKTLTISEVRIEGNNAANPFGRGGGGIFSEGTHLLSISSSLINGNRTAGFGGGLSLIGEITTALYVDSVFQNSAVHGEDNIHQSNQAQIIAEIFASSQSRS